MVGGWYEKKGRRFCGWIDKWQRIPSVNLFRNVTFLRASCSLISLGRSFRSPWIFCPCPPPSSIRFSSYEYIANPGQVKCCNIQITYTVTFCRVFFSGGGRVGKVVSRVKGEARISTLVSKRKNERKKERMEEKVYNRVNEWTSDWMKEIYVKLINVLQTAFAAKMIIKLHF